MSRRRRWIAGVGLGLVALGALLVVFHRPILRQVAAGLVVEDRLMPSDAIVVLAGGTPWREATAAALFREQWAPRVVISREYTHERVRELIQLGVRRLESQDEARLSLEQYGVPADRIVALQETVKTTEAELRALHRAARADGYRRVILVTSLEHTRRVKLVWSRESRGDIESVVVADRGELVPVEGWWRRRRAAETVLHEYLGLFAIYLGISPLMR